MINKELIDKTITDIINKSHQHLTIQNEKVINTFNDFHDKYCGEKPRKSEVTEWTDLEGNSIFTKKGKKLQVDFTDKEIKDAYEKHGEIHMTHNHPRGNTRPPAECLSTSDINLVTETKFNTYDNGGGKTGEYQPFKSISAESSNGSRMTFVRGDKFDSTKDMKKIREADSKLQNYWENYYHNYYHTLSNIRSKTNINDFKSSSEYEKHLHDSTIKEIGEFEKNKDFKDAQKLFREGNCKLILSHPREYRVGLIN